MTTKTTEINLNVPADVLDFLSESSACAPLVTEELSYTMKIGGREFKTNKQTRDLILSSIQNKDNLTVKYTLIAGTAFGVIQPV